MLSNKLDKNEDSNNEKTLPIGMEFMDDQVAGHTIKIGTKEFGMLKSASDTSVLKLSGSPACSAREIKFYEYIKNSNHQSIRRLRDFIPEFMGTDEVIVNGSPLKFIKMRDLTDGIFEPCIMDIKMGSRTWDPLATIQKKESEESKYLGTKNSVGFCIPGFQVFRLSEEMVKPLKYGKDYGKKLNEHTVEDALRFFLNADIIECHELVSTILNELKNIQEWIQTEKLIHFYSSSILIIYDAKVLRTALNSKSHQFSSNTNWIKVKMIDFAHTFLTGISPPNEEIFIEPSVDLNYLNGINNLVRIFQKFTTNCNHTK